MQCLTAANCYTLQELPRMVMKGNGGDFLYLSCSKEFDTASHDRLLKKQETVGITGEFFSIGLVVFSIIDSKGKWLWKFVPHAAM